MQSVSMRPGGSYGVCADWKAPLGWSTCRCAPARRRARTCTGGGKIRVDLKFVCSLFPQLSPGAQARPRMAKTALRSCNVLFPE
jgi:hypothetical protein